MCLETNYKKYAYSKRSYNGNEKKITSELKIKQDFQRDLFPPKAIFKERNQYPNKAGGNYCLCFVTNGETSGHGIYINFLKSQYPELIHRTKPSYSQYGLILVDIIFTCTK